MYSCFSLVLLRCMYFYFLYYEAICLRDRAIETEQTWYRTSFLGSDYHSPPFISASKSADPSLLNLTHSNSNAPSLIQPIGANIGVT